MTDVEVGTKALKTYYGYMKSMYPSSFKYSESEFFAIIQKLKGGKALAEGLGLGIQQVGMTDTQVSTSMKRLAQMGVGKIPASMMDFYNVLIYESTKVNFVDAALYTVVESVKDVGSAAQAVGDQLIFTGKILNFLLPVILLLFVWFFLDDKSGGRMTSMVKGLKK